MMSTAETNSKRHKKRSLMIHEKVSKLVKKRTKVSQEDILGLIWLANPYEGVLDPITQEPILRDMLRLSKDGKLSRQLFMDKAYNMLVQESAIKNNRKWI